MLKKLPAAARGLLKLRPFRVNLAGKSWLCRTTSRRLTMDGDVIWGDCNWERREIRIEVRQGTERRAFNTWIHEAIHASCPWLYESFVKRMADELTVLFYDKLRYRRSPEE